MSFNNIGATLYNRVKSGKFVRSAKFGQRACLFHISIIVIKIY